MDVLFATKLRWGKIVRPPWKESEERSWGALAQNVGDVGGQG